MKHLAIIFFLSLTFSCSDQDESAKKVLVLYQSSTSVKFQKQDYEISFKEIKENSLCPKDSQCIWLGRIVVSVDINGNEYELGFGDLNQSSAEDQALIDGVNFEIVDVIDYDNENTTVLQIELSI